MVGRLASCSKWEKQTCLPIGARQTACLPWAEVRRWAGGRSEETRVLVPVPILTFLFYLVFEDSIFTYDSHEPYCNPVELALMLTEAQ